MAKDKISDAVKTSSLAAVALSEDPEEKKKRARTVIIKE